MLTVNATLTAELVAPRKGPGEAKGFIHPKALLILVVKRVGAHDERDVLARVVLQDHESGSPPQLVTGDSIKTHVVTLAKINKTCSLSRQAAAIVMSAALANIGLLRNFEEWGDPQPGGLPSIVLTGPTGDTEPLANSFCGRPLMDAPATFQSLLEALRSHLGVDRGPRFVLGDNALRIASSTLTVFAENRLQATGVNPWVNSAEQLVVTHDLPWLDFALLELGRFALKPYTSGVAAERLSVDVRR